MFTEYVGLSLKTLTDRVSITSDYKTREVNNVFSLDTTVDIVCIDILSEINQQVIFPVIQLLLHLNYYY